MRKVCSFIFTKIVCILVCIPTLGFHAITQVNNKVEHMRISSEIFLVLKAVDEGWDLSTLT